MLFDHQRFQYRHMRHSKSLLTSIVVLIAPAVRGGVDKPGDVVNPHRAQRSTPHQRSQRIAPCQTQRSNPNIHGNDVENVLVLELLQQGNRICRSSESLLTAITMARWKKHTCKDYVNMCAKRKTCHQQAKRSSEVEGGNNTRNYTSQPLCLSTCAC